MAKFFLAAVGFLALCVCALSTPVPPSSPMFGDKFQGDIQLTAEQENYFLHGIESQTGMLNTARRWPRNAQGQIIVPYRFAANAGFTQNEMNIMLRDFRTIEGRTCIRFIPRTNQNDFIDVINGSGCWSWLGRLGGRQELSMNRPSGCVVHGMMAHEAIHALGYDHMHNSIDRDNFVRVMWNNITPANSHNFNMVNPRNFNNFGTSYDLRSIMHYPRWAFSRNGADTIVPLNQNYLNIIGSMDVSTGDFQRLNNMYQC